jgi:REP element-mobilizing transposase RayT
MPCKILTDSLNFCTHEKGLCVNAYVIMPSHLHAIVFDSELDPARLKQTLDDFRKFTGRRLADYCAQSLPPIYAEVFHEQAGADRRRRVWQPSRHPEGITGEKFWRQKADDIHWNPVKKGLVRRPEDWRFSSAAFWLSGEVEALDVELFDFTW